MMRTWQDRYRRDAALRAKRERELAHKLQKAGAIDRREEVESVWGWNRRFGVVARRCEREVDHLEHRLEVARSRTTGQPLFELSDVRSHRDRLAGHDLSQLSRVERANPSEPDDLVGVLRGAEIQISRE